MITASPAARHDQSQGVLGDGAGCGSPADQPVIPNVPLAPSTSASPPPAPTSSAVDALSGRRRNYMVVRSVMSRRGEAPSLRAVVSCGGHGDSPFAVRDRVVRAGPGRAGAARPGLYRPAPRG